MIPKIIHFCWFGSGSKPDLVERCLASWHRWMPTWKYMEWSEDNFDITVAPIYVQQAYEAKKYAFVSDFVRLWALEQYGGLYMDVDFEVYKSFEPLLDCPEGAFVGREGSKRQPPMLGVMAAEPHSPWIQSMLKTYEDRKFKIRECQFEICDCRLSIDNCRLRMNNSKYRCDNCYDLTTNVAYFDAIGVHKSEWVHIYPVDYFCPVLTTGEIINSENTYCEHKGLHSWNNTSDWKHKILSVLGPTTKIFVIKVKRKLFG